ncbi:hypothetical protein CTI16_06955 [Prevotella intermedia]|jgi:hypothetical protein|uniref:Uncharacterized protein n=1 Tax=Prevotella intermedia TaxID=28131 RepID=A0AAJ3RK51_PREIN|nr:hypothetical protein [Prevotella intermedia]PIK18825.1 hypothetical protein CTI16_06955 [Prevotella intermedia]
MNNLGHNMSNLKNLISKVDYTPKNNIQYAELAIVGIVFIVAWLGGKGIDAIQSINNANAAA